MTRIVDLIRPEIRKMRPYRSAEFKAGFVRLNANENPWRPPGDTTATGLNWYPEPRPFTLNESLAQHYGVAPTQLLVTRGSSEGIDIVIRSFCRAGRDEVVICPPTFGMYEAYAQVQAALICSVPLLREQGYALDIAKILGHWSDASRVLFLCSPNNPTGNSFPADQIRELCAALRDRGVVVVDAAYAEFAGSDPTRELLAEFDNVVMLRTLSKGMALAGVRCGVLLATPPVTDLLSCILPPYTFPTVCVEAIQRCLEPAHAAERRRRVKLLQSERERLAIAFGALPGITRVWPSDANFLLLETPDPKRFVAAAKAGGVLIRDFSWDPYLPSCIRITVGNPDQNNQLLQAVS